MGPKSIHAYYESLESKLGYRWLLGGRKHFGFYPNGSKRLSYSYAMDNMESELIRRIDLPAGAQILDAGCGMGRVATHLAMRKSWIITGIDILHWNLVEARKYAGSNSPTVIPYFIEASYEQLPFPDNSFDAIYTMETFVHAENPTSVLQEFLRVLKPSGKLVQFEYEYEADHLSRPEMVKIESVIQDSYMPGLLTFRFDGIAQLQSQAGFMTVETEDITDNIMPMLKSFYKFALLPYQIAKTGRLDPRKYVNTRAAIEFYRTRAVWRYVIVSSVKKNNTE